MPFQDVTLNAIGSVAGPSGLFRSNDLNGDGNNDWVTPPSAPSAFTATAISSSQINLTWTDTSDDETGFVIQRSDIGGSGAGDWTEISTPAANATSSSNSGLTAETQYFYRIASVNGNGQSAWVYDDDTTFAASGSTVTASLTASRTSGPAPLAVLFSAVGTTHSTITNTWRELGYHFAFDDVAPGTWAYSGKSKNSQIGGPLASHLYETPGTYNPAVRAQDAVNEYDDVATEITVIDPDVYYSGTNTVCISLSSDTTGAPVGAQLVTNITAWSQLPSGGFESSKRYLLRAGQDFTSLGTANVGFKQDWQIGKFGTGADPIVSSIVPAPYGHHGGAGWTSDAAIIDISMTSLGLAGCFEGVTLVRGSVTNILSPGGDVQYMWDNETGWTAPQRADIIWPKGLFIFDSVLDGVGPDCGIIGTISESAICGVTIDGIIEHNLRLSGRNVFIGHDSLTHPGNTGSNIRHFLKMQAIGTQTWADDLNTARTPLTENFVVADTLFGAGDETIDWACQIGPEFVGANNGLRNIIIENGTFDRAVTGPNIVVYASNFVERGNVDTGDGTHEAALDTRGHSVPGFDGPYYFDDTQIIPDAPA